jgi:hypothetical protein
MASPTGSDERSILPAGPKSVHDAPVLLELFDRLGRNRSAHILDLGPASSRKLECYTSFAKKVRFFDLIGRPDATDIGQLDKLEFDRRLDQLLPVGRETFDLVLAWHVFDYLGSDNPPVLAGRLAAVAGVSALLHVMITTAGTMPRRPDLFEPEGDGITRLRSDGTQIEAPGTPPATVERWLEPFRVQRSVLLRNGVREFSAILT